MDARTRLAPSFARASLAAWRAAGALPPWNRQTFAPSTEKLPQGRPRRLRALHLRAWRFLAIS
jgi:hypothetical protein